MGADLCVPNILRARDRDSYPVILAANKIDLVHLLVVSPEEEQALADELGLVPNSHMCLLEVGLFPAATPRANVTTGWLNQVSVASAVCASTPVGLFPAATPRATVTTGWLNQGTVPLLSSGGTTLLTEKWQIMKRWAEHFRSVLTCSSAISDAAIDRLPQVDMNNDLDLPPSLPETIRAVQQISSGKAP
ncbi:unnamed protein product [Schistocephalus solidus]|uniref:MMR_HSR1_C domain-containing protein n=1 Tax=Schistocephalus solidus TaxID=70667 RepID=A0A183TR95_SCHSO|nr:unnamed protein product [Schistocephalus solidus]